MQSNHFSGPTHLKCSANCERNGNLLSIWGCVFSLSHCNFLVKNMNGLWVNPEVILLDLFCDCKSECVTPKKRQENRWDYQHSLLRQINTPCNNNEETPLSSFNLLLKIRSDAPGKKHWNLRPKEGISASESLRARPVPTHKSKNKD